MKKLSVILAALLLLAVAIPLSATAEAWPAEPATADIGETGPDTGLAPLANSASDFSYTIANGAATITGYTGTSQTVVIPETIGGYPVTAIGDRAFYARNNLISITMPKTVTSIGAYAFYGCNGLPAITIPERVTTIGEGAFFICSDVSSITIPKTVTSIGKDAFRGCRYLQTIEYNAVKLTTTNIAFEEAGWEYGVSVTFGESVKEIPDYLFYGCRVTSAAIPNSVTSIGAYAFGGCSMLTTAAIPNSVTSLGAYAFSGTALTTVTVPAGVTTIKEGTFEWCESLTSVTIPAGVTSLEERAFSSCSSLTTVTIPESVKDIGARAFSGTGLTTVTIPKSVTSIGESAFYECGSLASVTIPENVKSIGECAFGSCYNLTDIVYNAASVPDLSHTNVFGHAGALSGETRVTIGTAVERIPAYLFCGCDGLKTVTIPNNVTEIGNHAFYGCENLTTVSLPERLTSLEEGVFSDCSSLTGITLPAGLTGLGDSAFASCISLTAITIPKGVKTIGQYAFASCYELSSVTIQKGVTKIGAGAFSRSYALSEVILPAGLTEIGEYAFQVGGIARITLPVSLTVVGQHAFEHSLLAEVYYEGRETEWLRVSVGESNTPLLSAEYHFAEIPPEITVQPTDQNVPAGSTAVFTVTAEGTHLTYRWQYSDNGGETWINCDPEEGVMASFRFTVSKSLDGMMYRCVVTDEYGTVTSDSALLTVEAGPEFTVKNLVLSGQIGVNFFMDLDCLTEADRETSYMEFTISGKGARTTTDPFDPDHMNASKKYYGFTCYAQSIQMADTITATFHYGDGKAASTTYSVEEYFEVFDEHASENPAKTVALVHAIADYGHYMQIYLASVNHFDIGTDYAASTRHYTESYGHADILSKVEEHAIVRTYGTSKLEKANYRLQLGSETTLDVFLKTTDGSAPTNVKVEIREEVTGTTTTTAYTPVKQSDGRYLVTVPNISAHKLGDKVTVTGNAGGSFTVVVSPLSFVRDVLKNETKTESLNGLSSLYAYYMAAIAYKS